MHSSLKRGASSSGTTRTLPRDLHFRTFFLMYPARPFGTFHQLDSFVVLLLLLCYCGTYLFMWNWWVPSWWCLVCLSSTVVCLRGCGGLFVSAECWLSHRIERCADCYALPSQKKPNLSKWVASIVLTFVDFIFGSLPNRLFHVSMIYDEEGSSRASETRKTASKRVVNWQAFAFILLGGIV